MAARYAMLVDLRRCVGCTSCQVTCKMENGAPVGNFRTRVEFADVGAFPDAKRFFLPLFCNHCESAPCLKPCPVPGATYRAEDGTVKVNRDLCIGCGKCIDSCPFGARYLHPYLPIKNDPKPYYKAVPALKGKPVASLRVVDKCDWCADRRVQGEEPACARNCFGKAIVFGDTNDPKSRISELLAAQKTRFVNDGDRTKSRVFYVAADPAAFDAADAPVNPENSSKP